MIAFSSHAREVSAVGAKILTLLESLKVGKAVDLYIH